MDTGCGLRCTITRKSPSPTQEPSASELATAQESAGTCKSYAPSPSKTTTLRRRRLNLHIFREYASPHTTCRMSLPALPLYTRASTLRWSIVPAALCTAGWDGMVGSATLPNPVSQLQSRIDGLACLSRVESILLPYLAPVVDIT